jgi:hypothetical protein
VPKLIESLKSLIFSENFCYRNKQHPNDFIRTRNLPFHDLILFLLNMNNQSYQEELDRYFQTLHHTEVPKRILYKGNLSKARAKLKHTAFIELNDHLATSFYESFKPETWFGFNLLAVDGTTLHLPDEYEISSHFGVWNSTKGETPCPKARASQMFDVLNKITVDAIISPKSEGERELATFHFLKLLPRDLILLDRGYPAHWLFKLVLSMDANFCARISYKRWNAAQKFYLSDKKEQLVKIKPSLQSVRRCHEMGLDAKPIKVRMIRVELDSGETEILVTSLTDMEKFPVELFSDLYHCRWPVEEDYKTLKYRLEVENFSGKTVHSVYQDFHAKVFSKNLTSVIAYTTKEEIVKKSESLTHVHQINFVQALSKMKNTIVLLFKRSHKKVVDLVEQLRTIFIQTTEAVRPNRKYPRNHRVKQKRFFFEYKTTC